MDIGNLPLVLASASPRRQELLAEAGYKFEVVVSQIDESVFPTENIAPVEYAKQLAFAKANDVAEKYPDSVVIGADTVVDFQGQIIGKARDAKHAEEITRMLFSSPHKVITGLALVCKSRNIKIVEAETTVVYPRKLTDAQIAGHIESGVWRNKSGACDIDDVKDKFIKSVKGSISNIKGLPLELLNGLLNYFFKEDI